MATQEIDWGKELHETVVKSLATSFGLDFLLLKDQDGGDVNTIQNVRKGIYATEEERTRYENRAAYDPDVYHQHANYKKNNASVSAQRKAGTLTDSYTGETLKPNDKVHLDHIIAANEIHHDAGRILSELNGADLANDDSNLTPTGATLNTSKKALPMSDFVEKLQKEYQVNQQEIATLKSQPVLTEKQQKRLQSLENKSKADFERMQKADEKARGRYESEVNLSYYTSSKFALNVASASLSTGLRMGSRQMLGLILAEVWFEVHERIPSLYARQRKRFDAREFLGDIGETLVAAWERVKAKFRDFLTAFKDGVLGGVLSAITTTLFNIVFTTKKMLVRLIREMWNNLVQAFKIMVFNPDNLPPGQQAKAASRVIAAGIAVVTGALINEYLASVFLFPFGPELAAFCSALATGILTLTMNYFLESSALMQKLWAFLDRFKDKYQKAVDYFQNVNAELDRYILELTRIEFAMDADELAAFIGHLGLINDEICRGLLLKAEAEKRNISLPFEAGNAQSTRSWLSSL